jgi:hypothetical protein
LSLDLGDFASDFDSLELSDLVSDFDSEEDDSDELFFALP